MKRIVYFDMDGTIANLYGSRKWLDDIMANNSRPYRKARPLVDMETLTKQLKVMQDNGWKIGVVSWLAKNSNKDYDYAVTQAKIKWLNKYLKGLTLDDIKIVPYGTPKSQVVEYKGGILFDDEMPNRQEWTNSGGIAYDVYNIINALQSISIAYGIGL